MRVLPGMQSAFVDIGLERDAFLYVSDFFDEEEEFERIVIDKSKKGTPDAEHAAAEEVALNRVEREQRIEATQERVEPLLRKPEAAAAAEEVSESHGSRTPSRPPWPSPRTLGERRRGRTSSSDRQRRASKFPTHRSSPAIHRSNESSTKKRLPPTARCSKTLGCRNESSIRFTPSNSTWKTTSAPRKSVRYSRAASAASRSNELTTARPRPNRFAKERRPREAHVSSFIDDVDAGHVAQRRFPTHQRRRRRSCSSRQSSKKSRRQATRAKPRRS